MHLEIEAMPVHIDMDRVPVFHQGEWTSHSRFRRHFRDREPLVAQSGELSVADERHLVLQTGGVDREDH